MDLLNCTVSLHGVKRMKLVPFVQVWRKNFAEAKNAPQDFCTGPLKFIEELFFYYIKNRLQIAMDRKEHSNRNRYSI